MSDTGRPEGDWSLDLVDEGAVWNDDLEDVQHSLVDLVNRLLDKGVVIAGEVTISVAGVDLVYLGLNALLTSVTTARAQLGRSVGRDEPGP
jgi:gas vesicle structural protein